MERQRWGRRLLVALLVVGLSSGLGARTAQRAGALGRGGAPVGRTLAMQQAWTHPASEPAAAALRATSAITWTQQAELTSTAQTDDDAYGSAVAVSRVISLSEERGRERTR